MADTFMANAILTQKAASATTIVLLAANPIRRSAVIFNDSMATLYFAYAPTCSPTLCTFKVAPGGQYIIDHPCYRGVISGLWSSATGAARLTEITQ